MSFNWNNIRPLQNSQNDGFEELVCQIARNENILDKKLFIRKGKPDAGVECFCILNNDDEWAWQAKFFTGTLTNTQWGEVDISVKTALEKHPNLKKYFIAFPIDPPDARLANKQSLLQKWNSRVKKWEAFASAKSMEVEFIPWWSSDLIRRLQYPENAGLLYFWFNKEEFTDEWCFEQNTLSITELGGRYTPELNVDTELSEVFDAISRNKDFERKVQQIFDRLFIEGEKATQRNVSSVKYAELKLFLSQLNDLFFTSSFKGILPIRYDDFRELIDSIHNVISDLDEEYATQEQEGKKETNNTEDLNKKKDWGYLRSTLNYLRREVYNVEELIDSTLASVSNSPFLLLIGEAGIGKSHILADAVTKRNINKQFSILLLGQHFVTDEDPWTQIFKRLKIKCSLDEFLGALNAKAQIVNSRFFIFIDALNEGRGKYFWDKNVKSFIYKIKQYEWLGLVLSVRSSYQNLIFPKDSKPSEYITMLFHHGFTNVEYTATKKFFTNFNIELPSTPLLHPEFRNPLFLKLFCQGLQNGGQTRIPEGLLGLTTIIDFFINSINKALSKPDRLEYPENINVVRKTVDAIVLKTAKTNLKFIPYETAFEIAESILTKYSSKRGLLEELISEGLFSKNLFWTSDKDSVEGVYLAYERFEDHLIASILLKSTDNVEEAFNSDGLLFPIIKDDHSCYQHKGLLEALSIQLPEKFGKELYELAPHVRASRPIAETFIDGLIWRRRDTVNEKQQEFISSVILKDTWTEDSFWDTVISLTSITGHYLNANFLHSYLWNLKLPDRDAWWIPYLKHKYGEDSAVKILIDWAWNEDDKSHISSDAIKLSCITISWFLASTNRRLRDHATKALISLLRNRIDILVDILKIFKGVDDPYIYERLFAVAYGCAILTKDIDSLKSLSEYIYLTIFSEKEVYPHVLLRDYARGVIEYSHQLGCNLSFNFEGIRPPFKSRLPKRYPSDKFITRKYEKDYKSKDFKDHFWSQNSILESMGVEHGPRSYGDFGRYTFQSALRYWNVDANSLSNLAIKWIFEKYGYNVEKHGEFDRQVGSGRGRNTLPHERIGKKYQWIAFYEMLARVSDNHIKFSEPFFHKTEAIYEGPWNPYVRDIDPTLLIKSTGRYNEDEESSFWWEKHTYDSHNWRLDNKDWIYRTQDLPNGADLINLTDTEGNEWLLLEGFPEWAEPKIIGRDKWDNPHKRLWYQIRSYLIPARNYKKLKGWAKRQDFGGRWMPESSSRYEIFSREYYWSPAYAYHFLNDDGTESQTEIRERHGKLITPATLTTNDFLWEEENDYSKEVTISFLKPSFEIVDKMRLRYSEREGEFLDCNGNLVCFDPSVSSDCKRYLIIRKEPFLRFLDDNNLRIMWTLIGEKNIIGGWKLEGYSGRLEVSCSYFIEDKNIEECISTKVLDFD